MTLELLLVAPAIAHVGVAYKGARALVACLLALAVAVVVLSGSRAGWLGLGIALLLLGVTRLGTGRVRTAAGDRLRATFASRRFVAIVVVGILLIAVGAILLPGAIYRAGSGGEGLRATYFAVALRIFADHVLTGAGPGTWTVLRAGYTETSEPDFYIPHAHNIYLQTAAELGLLGLAAGCFAIVLVALLIRQGVRDPEVRRRRFAWAAAASCLYLGAHQLLDFYANMPAILFAFAIPVAYLDATAKLGTHSLLRWTERQSPRRLLAGTGALGLVLSVTFLWWGESNARQAARAVAALNAGDTASALGLAQAAVVADPGIPAYQVTLALALERAGDWPAALTAFQEAASTDDLPNSWLGAAAAQIQLGDVAGARLSLGRALRLGIQQPTVALDAGWLYLALGDEDAAIDSLAEALGRLPMLAEDPAWLVRPELRSIRERAVDAALRKAPAETAWSLALVAGRTREAGVLIKDLSPDQRTLAGDVLAAWGNGGPADEAQLARYGSLVSRATGNPLDEDLLVWCVRLAQHLGRYDEALRFREWVMIVSGGTSPSAGTIRMTFEDVESPDPATVGTLASFYGHYTYRRPTPFDLTPPGLPRLVLVIGEEPTPP
jgi:tetratricopeptide (TPR) repeat protein